jgi:thioredoxin 1
MIIKTVFSLVLITTSALVQASYSAHQLAKIIEENKKVVIGFKSNSCGACKNMKELFEEIGEKKKELSLHVVNIDDLSTTERTPCKKCYRISGYPTFIFFKDGKEKHRFVGGPMTAELFHSLLSQAFGSSSKMQPSSAVEEKKEKPTKRAGKKAARSSSRKKRISYN